MLFYIFRKEAEEKKEVINDRDLILSINAGFSNFIDRYFHENNPQLSQKQALELVEILSQSLTSSMIISKSTFNKIVSYIDYDSLNLKQMLKHRSTLIYKEQINDYIQRVMNYLLKIKPGSIRELTMNELSDLVLLISLSAPASK